MSQRAGERSAYSLQHLRHPCLQLCYSPLILCLLKMAASPRAFSWLAGDRSHRMSMQEEFEDGFDDQDAEILEDDDEQTTVIGMNMS